MSCWNILWSNLWSNRIEREKKTEYTCTHSHRLEHHAFPHNKSKLLHNNFFFQLKWKFLFHRRASETICIEFHLNASKINVFYFLKYIWICKCVKKKSSFFRIECISFQTLHLPNTFFGNWKTRCRRFVTPLKCFLRVNSYYFFV